MTTAQSTTEPTHAPTSHRLAVPGAELHYEVRGSGPLLLVVGQPMTSGPFAPVADLLATDRTVVTYDPRGMGRSRVADPGADVTPETQAGDLAAIVAAVGGGPADAMGSSGGGVAVLALAVHHPDSVRVVVAHEPPVPELLPDAVHVRRVVDGVADAYRAGGAGAAWGAFVSLVTHQGPVGEDGVPPAPWPPAGEDTAPDAPDDEAGATPEPSPRQGEEDELFFLRMLKPFTRWVPAADAFAGGRPRVVLAVGAASGEEVARRSTQALAERHGLAVVTFPGGHGGFMEDPAGFAAALRDVVGPTR